MRAWIQRWRPAICIMLLIYIASAIPASHLPEYGNWDKIVKKSGHMLGYALLSAAYLHALSKGNRITRSNFIIGACLTFLYSVTDEWHQGFTPGRSPSVLDVGFDTTGGVVGLALYNWIQRFYITFRKRTGF